MEIKVLRKGNNLVVSSRVIAEELNKQHKHVLESIKKISPNLDPSYFIESNYLDKYNREKREVLLTRDGFTLYMFNIQGYNDFKMAYINKFNEMEKQLQNNQLDLPRDYLSALKALVASEEEKQILALEKEKVEEEKKRLIHDNKTYTATELAKELGFRSAKALNEDLRDKKIQYKVNNTWVLCARYSDKGYQSIKQIELETGKIIYDRKFSGKGRDWLVNEIYK